MNKYISSGIAIALALIYSHPLYAAATVDSQADLIPPAKDCSALRGTKVAPSKIGVISGEATVFNATVEEEADPARTSFCKITGEIAPMTVGASAIRFQVNLPARWNGNFLMTGGGGFNGILLGGLGPLRDAPRGTPTPLAKGYTTASTDSGHHVETRDDPEPARFTLNDEMFRNFAFASYKKTSDVARALIQLYYGRAAARSFYFGGSEGGREGLTMAQRYPADFDGIVSVVPVISWTGLMSSFAGFIPPQLRGGALTADDARLLANKVMDVCDGLDGLRDGAVSNYLACRKAFKPEKLLCPTDQTPGKDCLSAAQIATVNAAYGPTRFLFPLSNGVQLYPGRLWGGESQIPGDNFSRWVSTGSPPTDPLTPADARGVIYGSNFLRYVIARDPLFNIASYDPARFESRLQEVSALMDSTNPDLTPFFKAGGKLIIRENTADSAQSAEAGFTYYNSVVRKMGKATVDRFLRLYVSPSSGHGGAAYRITGQPIPTEHDMLATIDNWASGKEIPGDTLVQQLTDEQAPFAVRASRPMCQYPKYPHYVEGDQSLAASYRCKTISQ